jgi:hypothetical protein
MVPKSLEVKFAKQTIKNYLVNRSFLQVQADDLHTVLQYYKCIQVDPISIVARSHELALWNRVKNFKLQDLSTELYQNRTLFEYWLQLYSIIPIEYLPNLSARMHAEIEWRSDYQTQHSAEIKLALDHIRKHGVTCAADLAYIPPTRRLLAWRGEESRKAVLECLWDSGQIMIHHRASNQKYYDLTERIAGKVKPMSTIKSTQFLFETNFDYLGLVRQPFLSRNGYARSLNMKQKLQQSVASGRVVKINIDGVKTAYYVRREQLVEIENLGKQMLHDGLNILPPLDPLIIDRKLVQDIFDFSYTWEVYTPPAKRKFGVYGMPILYRGELVGQIDLKKNKIGKLDQLNLQTTITNKQFKSELSQKIAELEAFINS